MALYRDSHAAIVNVDISQTALRLARNMAKEEGLVDDMGFVEADARDLPGPWTSSFEMVLDKGTIDALSCSRSEGEANVERVLREARRVLTARGVLVIVTTVKETDIARWIDAAGFDVVNHAHLVTRQSQRRVPVLPNEVYVLRKARRVHRGAGAGVDDSLWREPELGS